VEEHHSQGCQADSCNGEIPLPVLPWRICSGPEHMDPGKLVLRYPNSLPTKGTASGAANMWFYLT